MRSCERRTELVIRSENRRKVSGTTRLLNLQRADTR